MHTRANYYEDEQRRDQGEMLRLQHVVPTLCCAVPGSGVANRSAGKLGAFTRCCGAVISAATAAVAG